MDRAMLLDHLAQAEHHVSVGARHIARQREIIAELERTGADSTEANLLLQLLEELQALHLADRDRLRAELGVSEPSLNRPRP